jgi:hypothetical protein
MMKALIAGLTVAAAAPVAAAMPPTPLFASDAPIQLTIQGPIGDLVRNSERSPSTMSATLLPVGASEPQAIRLTPRGITRLRKETCAFPPLRVEFTQPPAAASLFAGQRRLKLVTHCRPAASFQQHLLLEYSAYRIFNLISPVSYRARLATVNYVEPNGRNLTTRFGFFIEDTDDVARRNGFKEARVGDRIPSTQLEPRQSARLALFQYMIGNLDWSMRAGPAGEGCCHNSRLLAGASPLKVPVPYDFDYSGLVDAPYAVAPDQFHISSVRTRVYQGYCRHNGEAIAAAVEFRAARPSVEAMFGQIQGMDARTRKGALSYLARFYDDIATDASLQSRVLKNCVG